MGEVWIFYGTTYPNTTSFPGALILDPENEVDPNKMLVPNHYTAYLWSEYVNKHVLDILEVLADIRVLRLVKWYNRQANDNGFLFHEIGVPEIRLHSTC